MVTQAKGHCVSAALSKAPPRVRSNLFCPKKDCNYFSNAFDFTTHTHTHTHTHTLGSNSTATLEPSVVELITFAALSWSVIVLSVIFIAIFWCARKGKQSIKERDLEFYGQAMKIWLFQPWTQCSHLTGVHRLV